MSKNYLSLWNKMARYELELHPGVWLLLRVVIACLFGFAIRYFMLGAAYSNALHQMRPQERTFALARALDLEVQQYQQEHNALPMTLNVLYDGKVLDYWGRPFVYTVHGDSYTIVSYGQDGKPGGSGWNLDIGPTTPPRAPLKFSYHLFLIARNTQSAIRAASITGIVAAFVCFLTIMPRLVTRVSIVRFVIRVGITFLAACVVGDIITLFDIPTGH